MNSAAEIKTAARGIMHRAQSLCDSEVDQINALALAIRMTTESLGIDKEQGLAEAIHKYIGGGR